MIFYFQIIMVITVSFILGALSFTKLIHIYASGKHLETARTRMFNESRTLVLPFFSVPVLTLTLLLDIFKGVGAVMFSDLVLGRSDTSFVISTAVFLLASFIFQKLWWKEPFEFLPICGILLVLNAQVLIIAAILGAIVSFMANKMWIIKITVAMLFVLYFITSNNPISYLAFSLMVLTYVVIYHIEDVNGYLNRYIM